MKIGQSVVLKWQNSLNGRQVEHLSRGRLAANKLKLNPDKTEFDVFGSKLQQAKLATFFPFNMLGNSLKPADVVRNLDVWFSADLTFSKHVRMICKSCFGHIRDLRRLSNSLTRDALVTFVSSGLDYCNSLFRSLSS